MKLEALHAHVERLLRRVTGIDEILTDEDGDWLPFPFARCYVVVRVMDHEEPRVLVYGVAAEDVAPSPAVFEAVNDMNARLRYCRGYLSEGTIYVETELLGATLDCEELDNAFLYVADAANWFGTRFAEQFGGRTPLAEEAEVVESGQGTGLYL